MHPVLQEAASPIVRLLSSAASSELQIEPRPGKHRWCGQQVVEHLILTSDVTSEELEKRLASRRRGLRMGRSPLQWIIKLHVIGFGRFPHGVPTLDRLKPRHWVPEPGEHLVERLKESLEHMDRLLVQCRDSFGIQVCGIHPTYGPLRVDEWRRYHALHLRHHSPQLHTALAYAGAHAQEAAPSINTGMAPDPA